MRIFVQLNFIATVWKEIIYWYNDNHLFSFHYNSWSTQASVRIPSNIFRLLVMLNYMGAIAVQGIVIASPLSLCSKVLPLYSNVASYSYNPKNGWVIWAKYIAVCEEGNSDGVWHLCGFAIYRVWEELRVTYYRSLVDKFTCTSLIIVIAEEY